MSGSFYDYMYGINKKSEESGKATMDSDPKSEAKEPISETVAMDEGIGEWTHKYVVYCKNPSKEFEEEIKSKDGVVAVFMKEKESKSSPEETNPPNDK